MTSATPWSPRRARFDSDFYHLWRIAADGRGSPVPLWFHRAADARPGDPRRLLRISWAIWQDASAAALRKKLGELFDT